MVQTDISTFQKTKAFIKTEDLKLDNQIVNRSDDCEAMISSMRFTLESTFNGDDDVSRYCLCPGDLSCWLLPVTR